MKHIEIISGGNVISDIYSGDSVKDIASLLHCYQNIFIVIDQNLSHLIPKLSEIIPTRFLYSIQATEKNKDIRTVMEICGWLMDHNADRNAFLLGIGGGITTDLTGMAACIYKRGIRFGFLPTTLLAQTDAAIGGKNGVNYLGYKNMVGIIRQPEFTFECAEVLSSLSYEDFLSGEGELLKSFIIDNRCQGNLSDPYHEAIQILSAIHQAADHQQAIRERQKELTPLIMAAASVKAGIVGRDMNEKGERRKLNLGHTFAHAIEWKSGNSISHGKAVAIGTILAARLSEKRGWAPQGIAMQLEKDFQSCGLPTRCDYPVEDLIEAIKQDKKVEGGEIHFIFIKNIGEVIIQKLPIHLETLSNTI